MPKLRLFHQFKLVNNSIHISLSQDFPQLPNFINKISLNFASIPSHTTQLSIYPQYLLNQFLQFALTKITATIPTNLSIQFLSILTSISFGPLGKYLYLSILTISYYFHSSLFPLTHKVFNDASTIIMPRFIIISETPKEESLFCQSCPKIPIHPL